MAARPSPVIVFDGSPDPVAATDPNPAYGLPLTVTTGRAGAQGEPGDQNVLVLQPDENTPPDGTPDGTIIYRLLEAP